MGILARNWVAGHLDTIAVRDRRVVDGSLRPLRCLRSTRAKPHFRPMAAGRGAKAAYRLMDNDNVLSEAILVAHRERTI